MAIGDTSVTRNYCQIALDYCADVLSGKVPACELVKQACQRQLSDLERSQAQVPEFAFDFDPKRASRICKFAEMLPHIKGRWATKNIRLEPWQCFIFTTVFGWVHRESKLRRFRKALIVIPARNSKSTTAAIVGLYLLALDGEPGAEVYSGATTRDQAKIVWDVANKMVRKLPEFQTRYGVHALAHSIVVEDQAAFFKPLSRDVDSMEGLNAHGVIEDELAAHKNREAHDVLDERTGSRRQPLTWMISTEGDNPIGVFAEQVDYLKEILGGTHTDDSYFGVYYTIDSAYDWTSREAWVCANPNFGVSVFEDDMRSRCLRATKNPASQASFLTKRLNVRQGAGEAYINMMAWKTVCLALSNSPWAERDKRDKAGLPISGLSLDQFEGEECVLALDIATKRDLNAKMYLFREGRYFALFGKFYCPEFQLEKASGNPHYDVYKGWAEAGLLTVTSGNVIDFDLMEADLIEDAQRFMVREVAFDPWQAQELANKMKNEGLKMVEVPMQVRYLSEPMKNMQALIDEGRIKHDGNLITTWCMGNLMAKEDFKENVFPRKARNQSKIDAAVATIMALSRSIVVVRESVYNERGVRYAG